MSDEFVKTPRQREGLEMANSHRHVLLYGGARSGKTAILVRNIFLRAVKRVSKHLIVRFRYNHARISLSHETIPFILAKCFPGMVVLENKADGYWTVPVEGGGQSQVWIGGTDDRDRVEKILGNEYCLDPAARVLTSDLDWKPAGDLEVGEEIIGFPEDLEGHIRLLPSEVERTDRIETERYRVLTDRGETVVSARHLFVTRRDDRRTKNARRQSWVAAETLRPGDRIKFATTPWNRGEDFETGWFAGMLDGEGWITSGGQLGVAQNQGPVLDRLRKIVVRSGVRVREHRQSGSKCVSLVAESMWDAMRAIGVSRPTRLLSKARRLWEGRRGFAAKGDVKHAATVLSVESLGRGEVVALRTSTATLIADGFLGHNSTIYLNECSQIPFEAVTMLWTRLAETSGLSQRAYYDCNPPGLRHWTYRVFMDGKLPDGTPHDLDVGHLQINPGHNTANLSPEYLRALASLPRRDRLRFFEGKYLADVEGALWTNQMIIEARLREPGELRKTVIAVDPSVSNNPGSDECGIIPCAIDVDGMGVVIDDLSGKMSTGKWARRVVSAYHAYEANEIVAEVNNGGDLVADAIHNLDPYIKVVKVRASVGKKARAEPVSMRYEQGHVSHVKDLPKLEAELTETDMDEVRVSPNRLDALVWGLTHLMIGKTKSRFHLG